ncbi:MAG: hypothetical protein JSS16_00705 [Proteobacteria bacterium]|nr:hypothetical protein [Pseudomonadota bacterium]
MEARDDRNRAAATNAATATASSSLSAAYPVAAIIEGERKGLNWGSGGGWNDATPNACPDRARIDFSGHQWFDQVSVYTVQDNYPNPVEPTDQTTFDQYGITNFDMQVWNGVNWVTVVRSSTNPSRVHGEPHDHFDGNSHSPWRQCCCYCCQPQRLPPTKYCPSASTSKGRWKR